MANSKISALTSATTPLAGTETLPIVQSSTTKQVSVANLTAGRAVSASSLTATSGGVSVKGGPTGYGGDEIAMTTTAISYSAISTQMTGGTFFFDNRGTGNNVDWTWRNGTGGANTRMNLGATGDLTLSTGNLVIGTSGKGIDFSATSGSGTSELLADYEEGTWTPTIIGLTTPGVGTYNQQTGAYTKVGRAVHFKLHIDLTSHTGTGDMRISGLPFTSASGISTQNGIAIGFFSRLTLTAGNILMALIGQSATTIELYQGQANTAVAQVPMDTDFQVIISGTYFV